jgi:hypothetical protein
VALLLLCILAFSNAMPLIDVEKLFITDYLIRICYAALGGIPASLIVIHIKKKYKLDAFDYNTNFNPFKLSLND